MKYKILLLICASGIILFTAFSVLSDHEKKVKENIDLFASVFNLLDKNYVDDIDPEALVRIGIDAVLKHLDPYTAFYNEAETLERNKSWKGILYAGIGSSVVLRDSHIVFTEPYEGYGAWNNDIRAGDKLIRVEEISVKGKKLDEVIKLLRGEPETTVNIEIQRGSGEFLTKKIIRKEIKTKTVPYYGMIDSVTAYIKFDQFLEKTSEDFRLAFKDLKNKNNCKYLIIDIRENNGGLVDEAVKIAGFFLPENTLVCTLKSKKIADDKMYVTKNDILDANIPLLVLTSEKSVSAAEIFAGCMQDHDRAVIMGRKTYGKGFVQGTRFPGNGSSLYVTAARYYTPSGRCVQKLDYSNLIKGKVSAFADSTKEKFYTSNGRLVTNKGGVEPDVIKSLNANDDVLQGLLQNYYIFDFANKYRNENPEKPMISGFELSDAKYKEFINDVQKKNYEFDTPIGRQIADLEKKTQDEVSKHIFANHLELLKKDLIESKKQKLQKNKDFIKFNIEKEIIRRYYAARGVHEFNTYRDTEIRDASLLLKDQYAYKKILKTK